MSLCRRCSSETERTGRGSVCATGAASETARLGVGRVCLLVGHGLDACMAGLGGALFDVASLM
jgi:hypothetical protein